MGIFRTYRDKYGWVAIPARERDKRPPGKWKNYQTEYPTDAEVDKWDKDADVRAGGLPQVGIVTGSKSEIIVLDVDEPNGHKWIAQQGGCPLTVTVTSSPSDDIDPDTRKLHYYFKHPGGNCPNRKKDQWPAVGCDLRGDGGYIMAPPSQHPNVDDKTYDDYRYEWCPGLSPREVDVAPAPLWLLRVLQRPVVVEISDTDQLPQDIEFTGVAKGRRNDTAAHLAGKWCAAGLGEAEVRALLIAWNLKNTPPLPEKEIAKVAESISAREARNRTARMRGADTGDGSPWHVERAGIIKGLSAKIGIDLVNIIKISGENPIWRFEFGNDIVCNMTSAQVFNNVQFRLQIFAQVGVDLPAISDKKGEWGRIRQAISNAAEWKDSSEESTIYGELRVALEDYFTSFSPEVWDENDRPPINYPFYRDGISHIFSGHLLHFLTNNRGMKLTLRDLAQRLTSLGCTNLRKKISGFVIRVWEVPPEFMPPAGVHPAEGKDNVVAIKRF